MNRQELLALARLKLEEAQLTLNRDASEENSRAYLDRLQEFRLVHASCVYENMERNLTRPGPLFAEE